MVVTYASKCGKFYNTITVTYDDDNNIITSSIVFTREQSYLNIKNSNVIYCCDVDYLNMLDCIFDKIRHRHNNSVFEIYEEIKRIEYRILKGEPRLPRDEKIRRRRYVLDYRRHLTEEDYPCTTMQNIVDSYLEQMSCDYYD